MREEFLTEHAIRNTLFAIGFKLQTPSTNIQRIFNPQGPKGAGALGRCL